MNVLERATKAWKAAVMQWSGGFSGWSLASLLGRTRYDYASQVQGNGRGNSAVEACVRWICRTFPEATLQVLQAQRDGTELAVPDALLISLLRKPNAYYSGELLWRATLADWTTTGNAYWLKLRNGMREPVELWWLPEHLVQPWWPQDGSAYLSYYIYTPNGAQINYAPADIVHFRDGMDPQNTRKGLSPLASLLREIFTDDEAANYTASLLRNVGVPGVIIAPDTDEVNVTADDAKAIKAEFKQLSSGDNRGDPLVMPARVKVTPLGFDPQQMDVKSLRRIPEERVSAVLGVPAIVAGLGAGLDRSTFANMAEARELAYESNIIPNQRLFAADLTSQLLPEWDTTGKQRVAWDYRNVRVLQEDQNKLWVRVDTAVRGGWLTVARAQEMVGEQSEEADAVYLRSSSSEEVKPGEIREPAPVPAALAQAAGSGDQGSGDSTDDEAPADETQPEDAQPAKRLRGVESKRRGSRTQQTLLARLERDRVRLTAKLAGDLEAAFEQLAADVQITADGQGMKSAGPPMRITLAGGEVVQVEIPDEIDSTFQELYKAAFESILETTGATIAEALSMPIGVMLADPVARDMIRNWATRKGLADISTQTREAIMSALADGRAAGDGAEALARRIRGYVEGRDMYPGVYQEAFDRAKQRGWGDAAAEKAGDRAARQYRSETIARTETKIAQNKSSVLSYRNNPVIKGLLVFDGDDCGLETHDSEPKADGMIVSFDVADAYPLAHPRCLVGDSIVIAPNRTATFERRFDGEVIVLRTAAHDLITCTPNHPILTGHGWIAAGELAEGDYIIRCLDGERVAALIDPDNQHVPARIQQIARAPFVAGGMTTRTMPTSAEDFHGDGMHGKVYVERSNSLLGDGSQPAFGEHIAKPLLIGAIESAARLACYGGQDEAFLADCSPSGSSMGGFGDMGYLFGRGAFVEKTQGVLPTAHNSQCAQTLANDRGAYAQDAADFRRVASFVGVHAQQNVIGGTLAGFSGRSKREAILGESSEQRRAADAQARRDLTGSLASLIAPVRIVNIERREFSGHVYNLETVQGWYVADGIVTHNCVRSFAPIIDEP